jgi:hypothetical protein
MDLVANKFRMDGRATSTSSADTQSDCIKYEYKGIFLIKQNARLHIGRLSASHKAWSSQ